MSFLCIPAACRQGIPEDETWTRDQFGGSSTIYKSCGNKFAGKGSNGGGGLNCNRPPPSCPPSVLQSILHDPGYNNGISSMGRGGGILPPHSQSKKSGAPSSSPTSSGSSGVSSSLRSQRVNPSNGEEVTSNAADHGAVEMGPPAATGGGIAIAASAMERSPMRRRGRVGESRGRGGRPPALHIHGMQPFDMAPLGSIAESPRDEIDSPLSLSSPADPVYPRSYRTRGVAREGGGGGGGGGDRDGYECADEGAVELLPRPMTMGVTRMMMTDVESNPCDREDRSITLATSMAAGRAAAMNGGRDETMAAATAAMSGGDTISREEGWRGEREEGGRGRVCSPILLELFTAYGCSSCPRAERILSRLAVLSSSAASMSEELAIIALAFHVDYWDYLGLSDPYASRKWTARQRKYAQKLSQQTQGVYTPQLIAQGRAHCVGSKPDLVRELIRSAPRFIAPHIKMDSARVTASNICVTVTVGLAANIDEVRILRVYVALFENASLARFQIDPSSQTERILQKGTNLSSDRIVRRLGKAFSLPGNSAGSFGKGHVKFGTWSDFQRECCGVVVFLQDPSTMNVYGCQQFPLETL